MSWVQFRHLCPAVIASAFCVTACFAAQIRSSTASKASGQTRTKPPKDSGGRPVWRVDLHTLGFPNGDPKLQRQPGLDEFDTIAFLNDQVVAATFVTQGPPPGVQRRDDPDRARPYRLHAIFLDVASGKIMKKLDWPADNPNSGIFSRYDGSFLLFSMDRIVLYSTNWQPVKELPLPQLQDPHTSLEGIAESPSGKTLMVRFQRGDSTFCVQIPTGSLESIEGPCEYSALFTVSDDAMAARDSDYVKREAIPGKPQFGGAIPWEMQDLFGTIHIKKQGEPLRTLCDTAHFDGCKFPQFLSNDLVIVYDWRALGLMDNRGIFHGAEVKFQRRLPYHGEWMDILGRPVRPSANGLRFVVAFNRPFAPVIGSASVRVFPGDVPAATPNHVEVYDLPEGAWIYSLKGSQFKQIWGLALSPRGENLAIDSGGFIQVFKLPPPVENLPPKN